MSPMGKCCPGTHETFTHDGYMSPMMGICRHGYMSHGYMSPNRLRKVRTRLRSGIHIAHIINHQIVAQISLKTAVLYLYIKFSYALKVTDMSVRQRVPTLNHV